SDIRTRLIGRKRALLIVIDNAQYCSNHDALSFLFEAAEATPCISILLLGTDEPAFVSSVRSRGIIDWRLPGLVNEEARELVELSGGDLSPLQLEALEILRLRVDGHVGMIRLGRQAI